MKPSHRIILIGAALGIGFALSVFPGSPQAPGPAAAPAGLPTAPILSEQPAPPPFAMPPPPADLVFPDRFSAPLDRMIQEGSHQVLASEPPLGPIFDNGPYLPPRVQETANQTRADLPWGHSYTVLYMERRVADGRAALINLRSSKARIVEQLAEDDLPQASHDELMAASAMFDQYIEVQEIFQVLHERALDEAWSYDEQFGATLPMVRGVEWVVWKASTTYGALFNGH
jgi:hypothetical protein